MNRFAAPVVCALLALAAPLQAQEARELDGVFRAVASQWGAANPAGVMRHMAPAGVSIDVSDGPMGPLGERQAVALLRQLFDQGETIGVQIGMLERVRGEPPRAFGAITWVMRPQGTRVPVRRTVYFGLQWVGGTWRVAEIRLIP